MSAAAVPARTREIHQGSGRVKALDGVRGLAILTVMISHGWYFFRVYPSAWYFFPIHIGWTGVDLFFALSGYLITDILIRTKAAPNRAKSFYMRRVLRIFPLYYGALLAIFLAVHVSVWVRSQIPMHTWKGWLIYVVYLQNWYILHNARIWWSNMSWHFWSLAAEEQFYLLWPWIAWNASPRNLVRISVLAMLGGLFLRCFIMWQFGPPSTVYESFLTPTRGDGLFIGAAIAAYSSEHGGISQRALAVLGAVGTAIIAAILFVHPNAFLTGAGSVYIFTIGLTAFALISGALVGSSQHFIPGLTAFLSQSWLRSLGKYSYGIYVYHNFIFVGSLHFAWQKGLGVLTRTRYAPLFLLIDIPLSYGIAVLSYKFYESRFLRLKDRFTANVPGGR